MYIGSFLPRDISSHVGSVSDTSRVAGSALSIQLVGLYFLNLPNRAPYVLLICDSVVFLNVLNNVMYILFFIIITKDDIIHQVHKNVKTFCFATCKDDCKNSMNLIKSSQSNQFCYLYYI